MGKGKSGGEIAFLCLVVILIIAFLGLGIAKIVIGIPLTCQTILIQIGPTFGPDLGPNSLQRLSADETSAIYLHDCDIERMIPIFLIVSACTPVLNVGFGKTDDDGIGVGTICGMIGFLFNSVWQVLGSVWVYGTWGILKADSYIPCNGANVTEGCTQGTCNDTLLNFSFGMVTLDWIVTGLWIAMVAYTIKRACC